MDPGQCFWVVCAPTCWFMAVLKVFLSIESVLLLHSFLDSSFEDHCYFAYSETVQIPWAAFRIRDWGRLKGDFVLQRRWLLWRSIVCGAWDRRWLEWQTDCEECYPGNAGCTVHQNVVILEFFFDEFADGTEILGDVFGLDVEERVDNVFDLELRLILDVFHAWGCSDDWHCEMVTCSYLTFEEELCVECRGHVSEMEWVAVDGMVVDEVWLVVLFICEVVVYHYYLSL